VTEIAAGNPRFRRMYRFVPMISAEEISLPKGRRCLRFKCNSFYELNAVNTLTVQLTVHDSSAVNDCILRFKYSSTAASASTSPFHQFPSPHLHIYSETCPWCEQDIPPEKLEEISGKIAARERQQAHAITAKLEQQYAIDKAQADAKAKAT
jgi:hypothetical protein